MKKLTTLFIGLTILLVTGCHEKTNQGSYIFNNGEKTDLREYNAGYAFEQNGWTYVHVEGDAFERGEQFGYLTASKYATGRKTLQTYVMQTMGIELAWLNDQAVKLQKHKIPKELIREMSGYVAGCKKAGVETTLTEVIGWNAFPGMAEYWWPLYGIQTYLGSEDPPPAQAKKQKGQCSAFIATGDATTDGQIVIGHTTFDDFWSGDLWNTILHIQPDSGHGMIMQAQPGYVMSMADFFVTEAQIVGLETTIIYINQYDTAGIPEWVRVRQAMQYGNNIDEWIAIMKEGNNGVNGASWLLGDLNTNEIVRFEQGYRFSAIDRKKDGYFFGCNCVEDPKIRNLECVNVGYNEIRMQTGGRRVRWPQLLDQYYGKIDEKTGALMLGDTWDPYLEKDQGGANTICAMYDMDPRLNFSSTIAPWIAPYEPAGSMDVKITTTDMGRKMNFWARYGRSNGVAFDAAEFLEAHPQWNWQKEYLPSRPAQDIGLFGPGVN
nr:peptidase C45 [Bacteroidota bacterium]